MTATECLEKGEAIVVWMSNKYGWSREVREDLGQEGRVALLEKLDGYDPERAAFSTWAVPIVRGACLHWLRDTGNMIRIPGWIRDVGQPIPLQQPISLDALNHAEQLSAGGVDPEFDRVINHVALEQLMDSTKLPFQAVEGVRDWLEGVPARRKDYPRRRRAVSLMKMQAMSGV